MLFFSLTDHAYFVEGMPLSFHLSYTCPKYPSLCFYSYSYTIDIILDCTLLGICSILHRTLISKASIFLLLPFLNTMFMLHIWKQRRQAIMLVFFLPSLWSAYCIYVSGHSFFSLRDLAPYFYGWTLHWFQLRSVNIQKSWFFRIRSWLKKLKESARSITMALSFVEFM